MSFVYAAIVVTIIIVWLLILREVRNEDQRRVQRELTEHERQLEAYRQITQAMFRIQILFRDRFTPALRQATEQIAKFNRTYQKNYRS